MITAPDALGELSAALDHLADDEIRARMSANAARLGRAQTFDNHVARLVKVFEEVAANRLAASLMCSIRQKR